MQNNILCTHLKPEYIFLTLQALEYAKQKTSMHSDVIIYANAVYANIEAIGNKAHT
jgi:hypothetical protein